MVKDSPVYKSVAKPGKENLDWLYNLPHPNPNPNPKIELGIPPIRGSVSTGNILA